MSDKYIPVNEHYMTVEMVTPTNGDWNDCEVSGEKVFSVPDGAWYVDKVYFERTTIFDTPPKEIVVVFKRKEEHP